MRGSFHKLLLYFSHGITGNIARSSYYSAILVFKRPLGLSFFGSHIWIAGAKRRLIAAREFKLILMHRSFRVHWYFISPLDWILVNIWVGKTLGGTKISRFSLSTSASPWEHISLFGNGFAVFPPLGWIKEELHVRFLEAESSPSARGGGWVKSPNLGLAAIASSSAMICFLSSSINFISNWYTIKFISNCNSSGIGSTLCTYAHFGSTHNISLNTHSWCNGSHIQAAFYFLRFWGYHSCSPRKCSHLHNARPNESTSNIWLCS